MRVEEIKGVGGASGFSLEKLHNTPDKDTKFQNMLSEMMSEANKTDAVDKAVNEELLIGDLQNLHSATIAAEKADIALRLTVNVRNKCVEAYNEIMRMQV